jgi:ribosomal protein L11 methylase PrmA
VSEVGKIASAGKLINSIDLQTENKTEQSNKIRSKQIDSSEHIIVNQKTVVKQNKNPGSFRDPSGFVFSRESQVFRQINDCYAKIFSDLTHSGFYSYLQNRGDLVVHEEVGVENALTNDAIKVIKPEQIPFISYPYEWSFSQLKDAALLTLDIQIEAIQKGFSLKDASAYNIQFLRNRPVFIDTLSFEPYQKEKPWIAYGQFCRHFLAPLALMSLSDIRTNQLLKSYIDGIPLDLATRLLPFTARFRKGLFIHLYLHANSQKKYQETIGTFKANHNRSSATLKMSQTGLLGILDSLKCSINKLQWSPSGTQWADYYNQTNYSSSAFLHKQEIIKTFLEKEKPKTVWDVGANDGRFSRIASDCGADVISFDIDPAAVEKNYLECKLDQSKVLLPLTMDLTNPSPAIGWHNKERSDLADRGPVDIVMALALVHHLAIGNNVPFSMIADFFASIGNKLIIEFVSKEDSQTQRILANREDLFEMYTEDEFVRNFTDKFTVLNRVPVIETKRVLYFMEKKLYSGLTS